MKPLSYTRARETIVGLLRKFVPTTDIISLYSFRAGGATSAANAQVPDRCWKRHGRWQSETAKDGYDNGLIVSKSPGIWFDSSDISIPVLCISIQCSSQFPCFTDDKLCFICCLLEGKGETCYLLRAVQRMAANRCFHGWPVFDSFHDDASIIRVGFCWVEPLFYADVAATFLSFRDILLLLFWFILLSYSCWICHPSPLGF